MRLRCTYGVCLCERYCVSVCVCVCALGERRHAWCGSVAVCEQSESVSACKCARWLCFYSEDYSSFRRHVLPSPVSNPVDVAFPSPGPRVHAGPPAESIIERKNHTFTSRNNKRMAGNRSKTLKHLQAELKSILSLNPGHDL